MKRRIITSSTRTFTKFPSSDITTATHVSYRVYQNYPDPDYPGEYLEDDCVNTFNNKDKAIAYAQENTTEEVALSVVEVIGSDTEVIWTAWDRDIRATSVVAARNIQRMTVKGREIQNPEWATFDRGTFVAFIPSNKDLGVKLGVKVGVVVGKVVKTYVYPPDDMLTEKDDYSHSGHNQSHNFNEIDTDAPQSCVIRVHEDFKAAQNGTKTTNLIIPVQFLKEIDEKTYVQHVNAIPRKGLDKAFNGKKDRLTYKPKDIDSTTKITSASASAVTVSSLSDLLRSSWETANKEWGNSPDDLLEWEDAFYCDENYRNGVASYILENVPQLKDVNMSQVHVEADEDDSSEIILTICIDGQPVDRCRTWYVADRWDAFMDEL